MAASGNSRESFTSDFERLRPGLPGSDSAWLGALRDEAMTAFADVGFPSVRDEDWKYTSVLPALRDRLDPVLPSEVRSGDGAIAGLLAVAGDAAASSQLAVFVDGCFQASRSKLDGVHGLRVSSLRDRLQQDAGQLEPWLGKFLPVSVHGFAALNTAFLDDGAVIEIAEGAAIGDPIHVVHLSTSRERPFVTHPRHVIVAGAGSSAMVVEHYVGASGARYLTNSVGEIVLGRGAVLGHVRVQDESRSAWHVARLQVEQGAASTFVSHAFGFGAALSRTEIAVRLAGEEAGCDLNGLYAIDASRHVDHHLMVDHASPRTTSRQLYKGILEDSARGVFTGRVVVRPGSQKIKATQSNPSLLLGRGAVAETRPQLEIYADDVACNHGASIGRLREEALFYLLSRGIAPHEARRLMLSGFAAEVVEGVVPEALRAGLLETVAARVGGLGQDDGKGAAS
ncbi:MAG: Fe-S cluster assembly protein SufD [Candidatus Binatia bacterium]